MTSNSPRAVSNRWAFYYSIKVSYLVLKLVEQKPSNKKQQKNKVRFIGPRGGVVWGIVRVCPLTNERCLDVRRRIDELITAPGKIDKVW
jgi:hypothetical protein